MPSATPDIVQQIRTKAASGASPCASGGPPTCRRRSARGRTLALAMKLRAIDVLRKRGVALFGTTNGQGQRPDADRQPELGYDPEPAQYPNEKKALL